MASAISFALLQSSKWVGMVVLSVATRAVDCYVAVIIFVKLVTVLLSSEFCCQVDFAFVYQGDGLLKARFVLLPASFNGKQEPASEFHWVKRLELRELVPAILVFAVSDFW